MKANDMIPNCNASPPVKYNGSCIRSGQLFPVSVFVFDELFHFDCRQLCYDFNYTAESFLRD